MRPTLIILPYAGLILATFSTVWGLTHELSTKHENGASRLTRAGRYSIGFVLLGLFISLNTAVLKSVSDAQEKADAETASARKRQEDALQQIAAQQREESLARQTQERIDRKAEEQQQLNIEGFSKTEGLAREQMLGEVQRAAKSAEQAQKIIKDLDRSLHPLFPLKVHATFLADLRPGIYAAYRERLIKAASADEESAGPELAVDSPLFPDKKRDEKAYNLLMAPPQMSVWFIQHPVAPEWYDKQEPDVNFVLENTAADPPLAVGQKAIARPKIDKEYGFDKDGIVSIRFPAETIKAPSYSDGHMVSTLDLLGSRMAIHISPWFTLYSVSIELPGGLEMQFHEKDFQHIAGRSEGLLIFTFPKTKEDFSKLIIP